MSGPSIQLFNPKPKVKRNLMQDFNKSHRYDRYVSCLGLFPHSNVSVTRGLVFNLDYPIWRFTCMTKPAWLSQESFRVHLRSAGSHYKSRQCPQGATLTLRLKGWGWRGGAASSSKVILHEERDRLKMHHTRMTVYVRPKEHELLFIFTWHNYQH